MVYLYDLGIDEYNQNTLSKELSTQQLSNKHWSASHWAPSPSRWN